MNSASEQPTCIPDDQHTHTTFMIAGKDLAVQLAFELEGAVHTRNYRAEDAKDAVVVLGRLSSSNPGTVHPFRTEIGGHVDNEGRANLCSPIMSRDHAKLVFSGGMVRLFLCRTLP